MSASVARAIALSSGSNPLQSGDNLHKDPNLTALQRRTHQELDPCAGFVWLHFGAPGWSNEEANSPSTRNLRTSRDYAKNAYNAFMVGVKG
jgi:hypothetical protein